MRFARPQRPEEAHFDLTAMIDVVLLLIIFFAFTAQFTRSLATPLNLPAEPGDKNPAAPAKRSIVIDLTKSGQARLMGKDIEIDWLTQRVALDVKRAGSESIDVLVRADRDCSAAYLNNLAAALTRAGIKTWKLATAAEGAS